MTAMEAVGNTSSQSTFGRLRSMAQAGSAFNKFTLPSKSFLTSLSNSNLSIATMTGNKWLSTYDLLKNTLKSSN